MGKFQKQVAKFAVMAEEQMLAVVRQAIQDMTTQMQIPVKKGGRMPVKTGFLRWSRAAALNYIPEGPTKGRARMDTDPKEGPLPEYAELVDFLPNILAKMKIGDTFYWGWTAEYAYVQEIKYGFMESETAKWQKYIDDSVRRLKHG